MVGALLHLSFPHLDTNRILDLQMFTVCALIAWNTCNAALLSISDNRYVPHDQSPHVSKLHSHTPLFSPLA